MKRIDLVHRGVHFDVYLSQRFAVFYRYPPAREPRQQHWHDFASFLTPAVAHHVFTITRKDRHGADVYLLDALRGEIIAYAHKGEIMFEHDTDNESETP